MRANSTAAVRRFRASLPRFFIAGATASVLLLALAATLARPATAQEANPAPISVLLELKEPSVFEYMTQTAAAAALDEVELRAAAQQQLASVTASQASLATALTQLEAQEIYRMQRLYNGIAVLVDPAQVDALAQLPGVARVRPILPKKPDHARSVPFIGAPALWTGLGAPGVTGEGVRIAIIDTGIDYLHTNFGGPGRGYGDNDETVLDLPYFPGARVVGGFDFSGDDYNADPRDASYQPIPAPDPDPYDCYGHGTHVAGTAAGNGVTAAGAPYLGPYDSSVALENMGIAPGVAPGAQIYALKIFGCNGSSSLTDEAIEWAVDPNGDGDFSDHVDVINLSLGGAFGGQDDPTTLAVQRAVELGVIVVASAGNEGDHYYAVGSPGVADGAISVAAVSLNQQTVPVQPEVVSFSSRGPRSDDGMLKPDIAAPGQNIFSADAASGSNGMSLSGTSMAAPHVAGALALLHQLYPEWTPAELKALVMSTARFPAGPVNGAGTTPYGPTRTGAGVIDLQAAVTSPLFAMRADGSGRVSIGFGQLDVSGTITSSAGISITNRGKAAVRVTPSIQPVSSLLGAKVALVDTGTFTVAGGTSRMVELQLTAVAGQLRHAPDASTLDAAATSRQWLAETTGFVLFATESADGAPIPDLRLPFHAALRPVAGLQVPDAVDIANDKLELLVSGRGFASQDAADAPLTYASLFELAYESPRLPTDNDHSPDARLAYGDLQHVGVTSDITPGQPISETTLYFGVAMHGAWSSPNQLEVSIVCDVDGDGEDDYRLFSSNSKRYQSGRGTSDIFLTALQPLDGTLPRQVGLLNVLPPDVADTRLFDGRVMVLPVNAGLLGLNGGASRFTYRVETRFGASLEIYDRTPVLTYDVQRPGVRRVGSGDAEPVMVPTQSGTTFQLAVDTVALGRNRTSGLLFISHHNPPATQSQAVALDFGLTPSIYLPLVRE